MKSSRWLVLLGFIVALTLLMASCADEPTGEPGGEDVARAEDDEAPGHREAEEESEDALADRVELDPESVAALEITSSQVELRHLAPMVEVAAELSPVPDRQATVGPRVAGRVVRVFVNVGDEVDRGTSLLALESAEVGDAQADFHAARARAAVARRAAERARNLLASRVTSERTVEEAEGELQVAEAEVAAARTRLIAYGADPSSPGDPGRVVLASPMHGSVLARRVHVGQWVVPGDAVLEIVDLAELWLVGAVFERDLRHVRSGQRAGVEVRALPGEAFSSTVVHVGQMLEQTNRTAALRVVLPNPGRRLRPGMFATARLEPPADGPQVPAVPAAAVQELEGRHFVFVPVGAGVFDVRWVRLGEGAGEWVEVADGLAPGEAVVTGGSLLLRGQLLRSTLGEEEE